MATEKKKTSKTEEISDIEKSFHISFKKDPELGKIIIDKAEDSLRTYGNEILWLLKKLKEEGHPYFKK